jgi:hypothetical protein
LALGYTWAIGKNPPFKRPAILGVEPVVLGLAPVDGLHRQRVTEHEGNRLARAQVGEPVPGEHALAPDDQPLAVGTDGVEERGG